MMFARTKPLIRTRETGAMPARLLATAEATLWVTAGVVAARALWLAITPAGPLGVPPAAAAIAPPPALALTGSDPFFPQGQAAADAVSGLDLALLGTRVDAASGRGSAIIATPDGKQLSYGVGDEIMPGVRLVAVAFESVTLDRSGAREQVYIDQSGGAADAASPPDANGRPPT